MRMLLLLTFLAGLLVSTATAVNSTYGKLLKQYCSRPVDRLKAGKFSRAPPHDVWRGPGAPPSKWRCRLNRYGRRAFSIAGPTVWNSLPDELRDPACDSDSLSSFLRQSCLVFTNVTSALEIFLNVMRNALYKSIPRFTYFTYLLTPNRRHSLRKHNEY